MKQCDLTKGLVVFLTIMITLFCGVIPSSWAGDSANCDYCENQKFEGCYGFSLSGIMLVQEVDDKGIVFDKQGSPVFSDVPMASLGVFYLDGNKITGRETARYGTITFDAKFEGTYEVAGDCMGTVTICAIPIISEGDNNSNPPPLSSTISFVITSEEELQMVTTSMKPCGGDVSSTTLPLPVPIIEPINIVGIAKKL